MTYPDVDNFLIMSKDAADRNSQVSLSPEQATSLYHDIQRMFMKIEGQQRNLAALAEQLELSKHKECRCSSSGTYHHFFK
jgi:hypothetical protein